MMEGGCHLAALKGDHVHDPQVIADAAPFPAHRKGTSGNPYPY
jgi:hypothetical protein